VSDGGGQAAAIVRIILNSVLANNVGQRGTIADDDRRPARERLEGRKPEPLVQARIDEHVAG